MRSLFSPLRQWHRLFALNQDSSKASLAPSYANVQVRAQMKHKVIAYNEVVERILFDPDVASYAVYDRAFEEHLGKVPADLYFACTLLFSASIHRQRQDAILTPCLTGTKGWGFFVPFCVRARSTRHCIFQARAVWENRRSWTLC